MATRVRNRYRPNRDGVVGILTSAPMRAALSRVGQEAAKTARQLSPVDTGRYRDSFEVRLGTRGSGKRKRAQVTVKNTAPYAASLEFGTTGGLIAGRRTGGRGTAYRGKPLRILGRTQSMMRARGYVR